VQEQCEAVINGFGGSTVDFTKFVQLAGDLECAGLLWQPEIGDEVSEKGKPSKISVLVDPMGMTPEGLRSSYLWLPTVEQMVLQLEMRQAMLFHAGLELTQKQYSYRTVIRAPVGHFEGSAGNLRTSLALGLRAFLLAKNNAIQ
jgi:hypothetical protein